MKLYLDNAATTKVDEDVMNEIFHVMNNVYGNPSSIHSVGNEAKQILIKSSKDIAKTFNVKSHEIIFTSGACEANTLALLGYASANDNVVLITTKLEHKSIRLICESNQIESEYVSVNNLGEVNLSHLDNLCKSLYEKKKTILVSIQSANSEIGTIQDIKSISKIVHKYKGIFHTDATQYIPYHKIDVKALGIDMLSMSGQKIHAPKGIGLLYVKENVKLNPIIYGTQMRGIRGGTENIPYIAGLAKAIGNLYKNDMTQVSSTRDKIIKLIKDNFPYVKLNGSIDNRLPNNINVSFPNLEGESLLLLLNNYDIYISTASACSSGSMEISDTLKEIGLNDDYGYGTIRITIPDNLSDDEISYFIDKLKLCVDILSNMN